MRCVAGIEGEVKRRVKEEELDAFKREILATICRLHDRRQLFFEFLDLGEVNFFFS